MSNSLHPELVAKGECVYGTAFGMTWGLNLPDQSRAARSLWYANTDALAHGFYRAGAFTEPTGPVTEQQRNPALTSGAVYRDCVFEGDVGIHASQNTAFIDCTFRDGQVALSAATDLLVMGCRFDRASLYLGRDGHRIAVAHNLFYGLSHKLTPGRLASGTSIAYIGNQLVGTGRGFICQTMPGDVIDGCLFLGNRVSGADSVHGGDEHFMLEGPGIMRRCLWISERWPQCDRVGFTVWGSGFEDNVVYDLQTRGASGVWFFEKSEFDTQQRNNYFLRCEFRGGGYFRLGGKATDNRVWQCTWAHTEHELAGNLRGKWSSSALVAHQAMVTMAGQSGNAVEEPYCFDLRTDIPFLLEEPLT